MIPQNPYQPASQSGFLAGESQKVAISVFGLFRRGIGLISGQYWILVGVTFLGTLIANAVPLGLAAGPIFVGIALCYLACERGETVSLSMLFDGFDFLKDALIASLMLFVLPVVVAVPLFFILFFALVLLSTTEMGAVMDDTTPGILSILVILAYAFWLFAAVFVTAPFLFTFHLIAEKGLPAMQAIKQSSSGVFKNVWGIFWYLIVVLMISIVMAFMCYLPLIFFMPVGFASLFLLYRDIFPLTPPLPPE